MSELLVLDKLRPPSVDTGALVKYTESSFAVIERWNDTRSKDPDVEDIIHRVRDVGVVFFSTIKSSVEVAQRGLDVSRDAITIFQAILDGESVEEIREFVASTRMRTMTVHNKSKHVSSRFQDVSIGLGKIFNEIPAIDERLQAQEQQALEKNAVAKRRGDGVAAFQKASIAAVGAVGGVACAIFPPAGLIMPVAIPLVILATEIFRYKNNKHIKERETVARDCRDAINELHDVSKALLNLRKGVEMFSEFWLQLDTSLDELVGRIKEFQGRKATRNRLQLRAILAIWEQLRDGYAKYLSKLKQLQQMYHLSQVAKRNTTQRPSSIEGPPKAQVLKKPKMAITPSVANEKSSPAAKKERQNDSKGKSDSDASKKKHDDEKSSPAAKKEGQKDSKGKSDSDASKKKHDDEKSSPAAKKEGQKDSKGKSDSDASKKQHDGQVESPSKKGRGKSGDGEASRKQQTHPPKNTPPAKKDAPSSPNGKDAGPKDKDSTRNQGRKDHGVKQQASKGQVKKKTVRFTPSTSS